jgi:hypothetical protein
MKKSTILKVIAILGITVLGYMGVFAQTPSPSTVSLETTTMQRHGVNSSGNPTVMESIDSLTIGAVDVKYFVYPDSAISPLYNIGVTGYNANINSDFTWSVTPNTGVSIDTVEAAYHNNYAKITYPSTLGDYTVQVIETAKSSSCQGTAKSFIARLIAIPNVTGGSAAVVSCPSSATPYNMNVPTITLAGVSTSVIAGGAQQVRITYTLTGPVDDAGTLGTIGTANTVLNLAENTASPVLDLSALNGMIDYPGTYTFDISNITDRISRKSGVNNDPNVSISFIVSRRPVTGPIYHVPNL